MEQVKNDVIEEKQKRTTKQKVFLGLEIAGNAVFYLVLLALFLFALFNINGGNGTENFPNIFGRGMLNVISDSMDHEGQDGLEEWQSYPINDGFSKGDLIFAKTYNETEVVDLKIGDVIVFAGKVDGEKALITHRIVFISTDKKSVVTQGDYAAMEFDGLNAYLAPGTDRYNEAIASGKTASEIDSFNYKLTNNNNKAETVLASNIRGVVTSVSAGSGKVLQNIQDNYLFYFVLPVAVLLIFEIFLVVRNIVILRGEKNKAELAGTKEAMLADIEAEKERMRQELLAEMRAQGLVIEDNDKEDSKEELNEQVDEPVNDEVGESTEDNKEEVAETTDEEKKVETEEETASEE